MLRNRVNDVLTNIKQLKYMSEIWVHYTKYNKMGKILLALGTLLLLTFYHHIFNFFIRSNATCMHGIEVKKNMYICEKSTFVFVRRTYICNYVLLHGGDILYRFSDDDDGFLLFLLRSFADLLTHCCCPV